jgi:hypothetical protein
VRFGAVEPVGVKRLRELEKENARLKKIVADRDLERDFNPASPRLEGNLLKSLCATS